MRPTPALSEAITAREHELRTITAHVLTPDHGGLTVQLDDLRTFVTERLAHITDLLNNDVERARAVLGAHVTEIRMQPGKDHYVATGEWNLLGNQAVSGERDMRIWMVAGEGFEPSTFGL